MPALFGFDCETHMTQPGLALPPLVCASTATPQAGTERLLTAQQAREWYRESIKKDRLAGSHIFFDMAEMCAEAVREWEKGGPEPSELDDTFHALEEGRVICTDTTEKLHDIGRGTLFKEPTTGAPFTSYHLQRTSSRYIPDTGLAAQKWGEDSWRKRYKLLEWVPLHWWPDSAGEYAKHDARLPLDTALAQARHPTLNRQCIVGEMRAGFALQLSAAWGMRTDPVLVPEVVGEIKQEHEDSRWQFLESGIVGVRTCKNKRDKQEDGTPGEPYLETPDSISAEELEKVIAGLPFEPWAPEFRLELVKACKWIRMGKPVRFCTCTARLRDLVTRAYAGAPPQTEGGDVSTARETLQESGDELLEAFGEAGPNEKLYAAFSDLLLEGMLVPINPSPQLLMETARTSYRKPNLQQLPRKSRVRECFVPRKGWVYCSVDYSTLELCTLAQVCHWLYLSGAITTPSRLRDALNAGQDLHLRLAARIAGVTFERAQELKEAKDPLILALRQLSKPINFGLPGGMGPPKLVATARKDGVRFCVLVGQSRGKTRKGEATCGPKVTEWGIDFRTKKPRKIAPTCEDCLRLAAGYKKLWAEEWPEVPEFHKWVKKQNKSQPIFDEDTGEEIGQTTSTITSFGNRMIRAGVKFADASNHFFQNLAAQGAKHALWLLSKECYTDRNSPLWGSRPVVFVHDEVIAELPAERAAAAGERMAQIMVEAMKLYVPDVRIAAEPALMERWYKGADTVRVEGELQVWRPPCGCKADGWKKGCAPVCDLGAYREKRQRGDWKQRRAA